MNGRRDPDLPIAAWLQGEAPDRAPERLLTASRDRIRMTQQRRAWWPARRVPTMNGALKLAIAAVAVVVVAVVGFNLLPRQSGIGGPGPSPSAVPSPNPSAVPSPTPSSTPSTVNAVGSFAPGTT
jgi:MFS superfamily sulfate permease-like transporter